VNLSKHFCFRPWTEIYSHFESYGPCCVNYKLYQGDIASYSSSQELKTIKREFLNGEKPVSCNECWKTEAAGVKSIRQRDTIKSKNLQRLSISLSNKCNFKCRMCNPEDSSAWALDSEACKVLDMKPLAETSNTRNIDYIIQLCRTKKITLSVLGGEPLITDEYIYLLEQIDKYDLYENIYLSLTTNLSKLSYKGVNHLDEWDKFTNIDVYASFDGVGKVGEYIRQGYIHDKFCKNLQLSNKYVKYLATTIQIYNIFDLPNIFSFSKEYNIPIDFNFLVYPTQLSLGNLSLSDRNLVLEYYKSVNFYNEEIFNVLTSSTFLNTKSKFIDYTNSIDRLWKKSYKEYLPELSRLFDNQDRYN